MTDKGKGKLPANEEEQEEVDVEDDSVIFTVTSSEDDDEKKLDVVKLLDSWGEWMLEGGCEKSPTTEEEKAEILKQLDETDLFYLCKKVQNSVKAEESPYVKPEEPPYVGDKEPISTLAAEYQPGSPIIQEKIEVLMGKFSAIRRTRGDGNCFYRCFMFAYLEHILESQDQEEVDRIQLNVEHSMVTLVGLGFAEHVIEDYFELFNEQLESLTQGSETSISHDELVRRSQDPSISDTVVMFLRFVTCGEIRRRAEFYEPSILGISNMTVQEFCRTSVLPMREESDDVQISALSEALGVPIRVMYLDNNPCCDGEGGVTVNHHDIIPLALCSGDGSSGSMEPVMTLLYRASPGHYDILYPK